MNGAGGGQYPLIVPANAEVFIVDPISNGDNGTNGNVVAMRIPIGNLPPEVILALREWAPDSAIRRLIEQNRGWLYIGYSHLSQINIPEPLNNTYPTVLPTTPIGISGDTGVPSEEAHLDISVYYVSGRIEGTALSTPNGVTPTATRIGLALPNRNAVALDPYQVYFSIYADERYTGTTYINDYGYIALIDPLVLWPVAAEGIPSESIDRVCP